jgi:hypothetical protein
VGVHFMLHWAIHKHLNPFFKWMDTMLVNLLTIILRNWHKLQKLGPLLFWLKSSCIKSESLESYSAGKPHSTINSLWLVWGFQQTHTHKVMFLLLCYSEMVLMEVQCHKHAVTLSPFCKLCAWDLFSNRYFALSHESSCYIHCYLAMLLSCVVKH